MGFFQNILNWIRKHPIWSIIFVIIFVLSLVYFIVFPAVAILFILIGDLIDKKAREPRQHKRLGKIMFQKKEEEKKIEMTEEEMERQLLNQEMIDKENNKKITKLLNFIYNQGDFHTILVAMTMKADESYKDKTFPPKKDNYLIIDDLNPKDYSRYLKGYDRSILLDDGMLQSWYNDNFDPFEYAQIRHDVATMNTNISPDQLNYVYILLIELFKIVNDMLGDGYDFKSFLDNKIVFKRSGLIYSQVFYEGKKIK